MSIFRSSQEKQLWIYITIVVIIIFLTLFIGNPLREWLSNQSLQAIYFLMGMFLVGATILAHGINLKPNKIELAIWFGFTAMFLMFFLRLGLPERSHLIEYSVLTIFIHRALSERFKTGKRLKPVLFALTLAFSIGVIDEALQLIIPKRVFDPLDILFNGIVILMAIAGSELLRWVRRKFIKTQ